MITARHTEAPQGLHASSANRNLMDLDRYLRLGTTGSRPPGVAFPWPAWLEALLSGSDGVAAVDRVVASNGRYAVEALAAASCSKSPAVSSRALESLALVCRTSDQLFRFLAMVGQSRGWGRGLRRSVQVWYAAKPLHELAREAALEPARLINGERWSHRDVLRLAHVRPQSPSQAGLFRWIATGAEIEEPAVSTALRRIAKSQNALEVASLMRDHRIPMAAVGQRWRESVDAWAAVLVSRPLAEVLPHLGDMAQAGLLVEGSTAAERLESRLAHPDTVSPMEVACALRDYVFGEGHQPLESVVGALDGAFRAASRHSAPTGLRSVWAVGRQPCEFLACALSEMEREGSAYPVAAIGRARDLPISPRMSLLDAHRVVSILPGQPVPHAEVVTYAERCAMEADCFVFSTPCTPTELSDLRAALSRYRRSTFPKATAILATHAEPPPDETEGVFWLAEAGPTLPEWIRDIAALAD